MVWFRRNSKKFNFLNNKIEFETGIGLDLYAINSRPLYFDTNDNRYLDRFSFGMPFSSSKEYINQTKNIDMFFEPKIQISNTMQLIEIILCQIETIYQTIE